MGLLAFAALLIFCTFAFTFEAENPESFPGIRDNRSGLALLILVLGISTVLGALTVAAVAARSASVLLPVALVCGLLFITTAYRVYTLAPMLGCWGHSAVARQQNGSYMCYDR